LEKSKPQQGEILKWQKECNILDQKYKAVEEECNNFLKKSKDIKDTIDEFARNKDELNNNHLSNAKYLEGYIKELEDTNSKLSKN